ncbi:hypothetical protein ColTof4_03680 [Colletotrichum tofieldiae]|nr:hypothetical protein ColTof3_12893 [Colletotrichum tofieldiae]GKT71257.1 hypothetical protein ColTof4_03680 [Colletotrichum tofieldiae]
MTPSAHRFEKPARSIRRSGGLVARRRTWTQLYAGGFRERPGKMHGDGRSKSEQRHPSTARADESKTPAMTTGG